MTDSIDIVIIDRDEIFLKKLATIMGNEDEGRYQVHAFSKEDLAVEYLKRADADILLIDDNIYSPEIEKLFNGKVLYITEDNDGDGIFKYSPAGVMLNAVAKFNNSLPKKKKEIRGKVTVSGVISFCDIGYKNGYALSLARLLSFSKKVLYMNFDIFAGWEGYGPDNKDISDVLYVYGKDGDQGRESLMFSNNLGFDYIMPAKCPEDIRNLSGKEISDLIGWLIRTNGYDHIVIDGDVRIIMPKELVQICDEVDLLYEDSKSNQIKEFKEYMERSGPEKGYDKIKSIKITDGLLPHTGFNWWDNNIYGWYDLIKDAR